MVGGMASGALRPNGNVLIANDFLTRQGAVGLAFSGNLSVDIIVSQGCRPIWRPFKVHVCTPQHRSTTLKGARHWPGCRI